MNIYILHILLIFFDFSNALNENLITNFTVSGVKTQQVVLFGCNEKDFLRVGKSLIKENQLVRFINLKNNFSLKNALTRHNHARTSVILDCTCAECVNILRFYSVIRSFNKTYQWMVWNPNNYGLKELEADEDPINIGPNAQITFFNPSGDGNFSLYDVHSKGRHLKAPIELIHCGDWIDDKLIISNDIMYLQGIHQRVQFNGLQLRGVVVVCINITNLQRNNQHTFKTKKFHLAQNKFSYGKIIFKGYIGYPKKITMVDIIKISKLLGNKCSDVPDGNLRMDILKTYPLKNISL